MKIPPSQFSFPQRSEWYVVTVVIKPIVHTALNLLALVHWNLHDVQIFIICFAAVPKRRRSDSTLLNQGPTLHHPTRGSFCEARGSTYFQCNISKYAHVLGLKLPKIRLVRAWFWVSSRIQNLAPAQTLPLFLSELRIDLYAKYTFTKIWDYTFLARPCVHRIVISHERIGLCLSRCKEQSQFKFCLPRFGPLPCMMGNLTNEQ